jgi:hypothetical protein
VEGSRRLLLFYVPGGNEQTGQADQHQRVLKQIGICHHMAALLSEETEGKEVSPSGRRGLHRLPLLAAPRLTIPQLAENVCIAAQNLQKDVVLRRQAYYNKGYADHNNRRFPPQAVRRLTDEKMKKGDISV